MQALAGQLTNQANGQGPNPAQAALAQATGQNVAQTGALLAGQRGASVNPALVARMAAQQGAGIQQQAAGQAATLQAQQQLAAQQALMQQQQAQAALAGQQVQQGVAANQNATAGSGALQHDVYSQANDFNKTLVGNVSQENAANAGVQTAVAQGQNKLLGGLLGFAEGGEVPATAPAGPKSFAGRFLKGAGASSGETPGIVRALAAAAGVPAGVTVPGLLGEGVGAVAQGVGSLLSSKPAPSAAPIVTPDVPLLEAKGGMIPKRDFRSGGPVPGKAAVKGDSYSNDTVDAKLSPGEVVIPRHVMQSKDPAGNAAKFVAAVMARKARRR